MTGAGGWRRLFRPAPGMRPAAAGGLVNGIAVASPLLAGIAAGAPASGAWACLGAYVAAFTNKGGPRGRRTRGLLVAAVANAAAFLTGELVADVFPLALAVLAVLVYLASLGDPVHPAVGRLGTMPATALLSGAGSVSAGSTDIWGTAGLVLGGGLWYAAASGVLTPAPRLRGVLTVLAEPYRETGRRLAAIAAGAPGTPEEHARTTAAVTRARNAVQSLRGPGGDEHLAVLLDPLVERAAALADLTAALTTAGAPAPETAAAFTGTAAALAERVADVADRLARRPRRKPDGPDPHHALGRLSAADDLLRARGPAGEVPYAVLSRAGRQRRLLTRLAAQADLAHDLAAGLPADPGARARPAPGPRPSFDRARLRAALRPGSTGHRHALRATAVTSAVFTLVWALGLPHGEWATLAVVRILRPRYADTLERAAQRIIGNVIGGTGAALAIAGVHDPAVIAALLFAVITLGFTLRPVNYAFWVIFGTPLILLIGDVSDPGDWHAALARVAMTLLGSAAALLGGYLLWPTWEQGRLGARTAAAGAAIAVYVNAVLRDRIHPGPHPQARPDAARAAAERALDEAHAAAEHSRHEPGTDRAATDRAEAVIRTLYALTAHLAALAAHPVPATARIPALPVYAAHAAAAFDAPDAAHRRAAVAGLADAVDEMWLHIDALHTRRLAELTAGRGAEDTGVRAAVREDEPVVDLLAAIADCVRDLPDDRP
ncbi:FUSC family protein [Streptomyces bambusae]|uniref:FUSC family protein n=1 Tax=Streptomyces bambusae TaxID=1550616 RepID=UPI001CFD4ACD|nr:FUSC family protein [Streptomyces bambusae]MCB5164635.1 FUSC family protein [Streptomyces bambusae]